MTKVVKKKARRLRRSIRRTLGTLFLISALVVAAIPVDYLQAEGEDTADDGIMAMADRPETDKKITLALNSDTGAKYRSNIPDVKIKTDTDPGEQIYSTGDGKFQFAYVRPGGSGNKVAVLLGYDKIGSLPGGVLTIPNKVDAYRRYFENTTSTKYAYVAVNKDDEFLFYEDRETVTDANGLPVYIPDTDEAGNPKKDEAGNIIYKTDANGNPIPQTTIVYKPCYYEDRSKWEGQGGNERLFYRDASEASGYHLADTENKQRIYDALVLYIGNQYLASSDDGWYVAGNITEESQGVFAKASNIETLIVEPDPISGEALSGIGNYAFAGCSALKSINLCNGLDTIGNYAFYNCVNMTTATIDPTAHISVIGERAFLECRALQEFTVPIAVRQLGDSAFENCQGMTKIDLTAGGRQVLLEELGHDVFKGCKNLLNITFPGSFSNNGQPVDLSTFQGCTALQFIASGTGAISENGVRDEGNTSFDLSDSEGIFTWTDFKRERLESFYLKGPELKDDQGSSSDPAPLHATATREGIPYSYYDKNLSQYVYEKTEGTDPGPKAVYRVTEDNRLVACELTGMDTVKIPKKIGPNDIKIIAERTFQDNCALKKITFQDSITEIEKNAFMGCHNLEDVIFENPPAEMTIALGAFKTQTMVNGHREDCDNKDHANPDVNPENKTPKLNFIGPISSTAAPFVYAMTPSENINVGKQDKTYITYQSGWPTNLEVRYNPDTDKNELVDYPTIQEMRDGKYCVKPGLTADAPGYAYITPDYAQAAQSAASKYLDANGNKEQANLSDDEDEVLKAALDMVLPDGIEAIGTITSDFGETMGLFEYKERDKEVWYGGVSKTIKAEGIEKVHENAFKGCINLREITFSDKTTSIGDHAFDGCTQLQKANIPATVDTLGLSPFRNCDILGRKPDGSTDENVDFSGSTYFTCKDSIIYKLDAEGNPVILVEYLKGKMPHTLNEDQAAGITAIAPEAFMYTDVEAVNLSKVNTDTKDGFIVPESAFEGTNDLFSVTLPNGTRRIDKNAFSNSKVRQVVIPNTVNVINSEAFTGVDNTALTFYCEENSVADDFAKSNNINTSYKLPEYEIRLHNEAGDIVKRFYIEQGSPLEIPEDLEDLPPRKGYTKLTWTPPVGTIITGVTDVYAKYENMEPSEYQKVVNFIAYDKETILSTQTVTPGEYAVPPIAPEVEGYEFTGWFGEQIGEDMLVTDEMVSPVTIYAQYEKVDSLANTHTVTFLDYDMTFLYTQSVEHGKDAATPRTPSRDGYTFKEWRPYPVNVTEDMTVVAQYTENTTPAPGTSGSPAPGSSSSPAPGTSASPSPSPTPGNSGSSNTARTYKLTVRNGSGSGDYTPGSQIIVVADEPGRSMVFDGWTVSPSSTSVSDKTLTAMAITMPANDVAVIANYKSRSTGTGNTSSTNTNRPGSNTGTVNRNGGNTVVIDKNGLSNTGVVSATVHGSSDNFTIKITEDSSATEAVVRALQAEYGNLENVKYFPMDISLYDSTGNTKITDTTGLSVSITLPLPDSLITYAGNNKVAGVVNDKLDKLTPRFTTIDGVSCITFTAEHFSPYVIYVDVANLSDGTISDNTPTTGDGIHPKWFLSIGLACLSFVMFMMKDNAAVSRKKRKVAAR